MAHKFELSRELRDRIDELRTDMDDAVSDHRNEWEERSDRWREGEKGQAVDIWIDQLADLVDALDAVEPDPDC